MRNVTQVSGYSDETRVGIFGADPTALAFFVMWRPFLWLFGHVENFSTRPIALASFVTRRKKRGLSGHIEKFSTHRKHLASFVTRRKKRGVLAVQIINDRHNLLDQLANQARPVATQVGHRPVLPRKTKENTVYANHRNNKSFVLLCASHQTQSDADDAMLMRC